MLGPDLAYVARFGEHCEWNALHDAHEWQPPTNDQVAASDKVQQSHFSAFFGAAHGTRYALSPTHRMSRTLRIVLVCLQQWRAGGLWLHLRRALRARLLLRGRVRAARLAVTQRRGAVLEGWLAYWQSAEAKVHGGLLARMNSCRLSAGMSAERASQVAQAQVMTSTSEEVKLQVLWELYWLLHAQFVRRQQLYWARCRALLSARQRLRAQAAALGQHLPPPVNDFVGDEPVSLRAVNATLFILSLQAPQFQHRAGEEFTLKELLLLANAPQPMYSASDMESRLRPTSGVLAAFMESSLCDDPAWMRKRHNKTVPLIPQRTWRVEEARTARLSSCASSEGMTEDSDEFQLMQLLEECGSPTHLRRHPSGMYSARSPGAGGAFSPRLLPRRLPSQLHLTHSASFSRQRTPSVEAARSLHSPRSNRSTVSGSGSFTDLPILSSPRAPPTLGRLSSSLLDGPRPVLKALPGAGAPSPRAASPRRTTPRCSTPQSDRDATPRRTPRSTTPRSTT
eukprot:EG_transcript_10252